MAVVLFDEVELFDVASVMQVTSLAGRNYNFRPFRLLPVARTIGLLETRSQLRLEAKFSFASCPTPELLFVPGGYGARRAAKDAELVAWCREAAGAADLVIAIGAGAAVLGAAGVLDGASIASSAELRSWLASGLPHTRFDDEQPIVTSLDGKLLTAARSGYGVELALTVVERCLGPRMTQAVRTSLGAPSVSRIEMPAALEIKLPRR